MSTISIIAVVIIAPVVVRLLLGVLNKDKKQSENKVGASRGIFAAGWGFLGLTALLLVLELIFRTGVLMWACIFFSAVFAIVFIAGSYELEIRYDKNGFTVRRFFRERQYRYEDIDSVIIGSGGSYTFNIKGKKLRVDNMMSGRMEFFKFAKKQHFARLGYSIKEVRHKLFNGHIRDPYQYLIGFLALSGSGLVAVLFCINAALNPEIYTGELIKLEAESEVLSGSYSDDIFYLPEGLVALHNIKGRDDLLNAIRQGKKVTMYVEPWFEDDGDMATNIMKATGENGEVYFSEEDYLDFKKEDMMKGTMVIAVINLMCWIGTFFVFRVFSNPSKYPKIITHIIDDDCIIW